MTIDRNQEHFYTKETLKLQQAIPGAKFWSVALNKVMFTYFEVEPNIRFELHQHESEQITMVLLGTLYFEIANQIYPVKEGEVIAIPGEMFHTVFTKNEAVKAVDAWTTEGNPYENEAIN